MDSKYILEKYKDCPDMQTWLKEQILAGVDIRAQGPHGLVVIIQGAQDSTRVHRRIVRLKMWQNQKVWKVQVGTNTTGGNPRAFIQTRTLEEAFFYFKRWFENPPPARG